MIEAYELFHKSYVNKRQVKLDTCLENTLEYVYPGIELDTKDSDFLGVDYVAFFNPEIINISKEENHMIEGCLSFPLLGLRITRPAEIGVRYQDFNGEWKGATFSGISARCFQHELDHMNGIVYTSKTKPMALQSGLQKRSKLMKKMKMK